MLFCDIDVLTPNIGVAHHQWVGVEGAHVTYIGAEEPEEADRFGRRYGGRGKLLMPACYNTHAHTPMTLLRGYAEDQPLQRWLNDTVWPFEGKMAEADNYWGCMLAQAEMARYGVVSCTDMYFATPLRAKATLEAGMKANHCDGATMCFVDSDYDTLPVAETNRILFEEYQGAGDGRVKIEMCIHAEYTTPESMVRRVVEEAHKHECGIHLHMSETRSEHEECQQRHGGMTPAAYFESCGVFDVPCNAAHCVWVTDDDIRILAEHGVNVSLNPASNMKLASGFAPVQRMLDAGVNLSLGTDGMASNNTHNLLQSAYLLACGQKGNALDPTVVPCKEVIRMLTTGGAHAQGREDCGTVEVGKRADLVVMDVATPWMRPVHSMAVNLLYSANAADICLTMCDGRVIYEDGTWPTIDVERVAFECERSIDAILAALAAGEQV